MALLQVVIQGTWLLRPPGSTIFNIWFPSYLQSWTSNQKRERVYGLKHGRLCARPGSGGYLYHSYSIGRSCHMAVQLWKASRRHVQEDEGKSRGQRRWGSASGSGCESIGSNPEFSHSKPKASSSWRTPCISCVHQVPRFNCMSPGGKTDKERTTWTMALDAAYDSIIKYVLWKEHKTKNVTCVCFGYLSEHWAFLVQVSHCIWYCDSTI